MPQARGSVETQRTEPTVTLPPWSIDAGAALRDARAGDAEAFRELVSQYRAQVFGTALRLTGSRHDATELAQQVFVALHGALPRIGNPAHLQRWLSRTIETRAADWHRQQVRRGDVVVMPEAGEGAAAEAAHAAVDPGAEFTSGVMVRLEQRRSHRRRPSTSRRGSRGRPLVWAMLAVAGIAVALLGLHWAGWLWPATGDVSAQAVASTVEEAPGSPPATDAAPAQIDEAGTVAATESIATAPALRDPFPQYTLIAMPLREQTRNPDALTAAAVFHTALLEALQEVPGLTVLQPGLTAPPVDAGHPADYLLTVTALQATSLASGGVAFRVSGGEAGGSVATGAGPQWPVEIRLQPVGQPASSAFASALQVGAEETAAALAVQQAALLRTRFFPDALARQQQLLRLAAAASSGERDSALAELLDTSLNGRGPVLDAASIAVLLRQVGTLRADQRAGLWRSLRGYTAPELVDPLLDAVRRDPEEDVRFEALATLASTHASEARVRGILEAVAQEDPQPVVRMAARRALQGEAQWRADVVARLADASLPYAQRLAPLLLALRSATLPAERLAMQAIVADAEVQNLLARMVREGWFDTAQADAVGDALGLLADGGSPAAPGLLVQVMPQTPAAGPAAAPAPAPPPAVEPPPAPPLVSPATMAWLLSHRSNPLARRMLDDIARGSVDPRLANVIEQMRRAEQGQRGAPRR